MVSTTRKILYLICYVGNGAAFSLLVKKSQKEAEYTYPFIAVVLIVELCKFVLASIISFYTSGGYRDPITRIRFLLRQWPVIKGFSWVAFGYFLYNMLQYVNLGMVSPATYRIIISTKVLWSGLMLQLVFGTTLSKMQWFALLLLIFGCGLEQLGSFKYDTGPIALILLSVQAMCSSGAGVINQYLLKARDQGNMGLWEKNMFLYAWGVLFTCITIFFQKPELFREPRIFIEIFEKEELVLPIIITNVFSGFSTSLLLRDMNVLYKEYANFAEMLLLVGGTWFFFGERPKPVIILATIFVCISLYMYNTEAARLEAAASTRATSPHAEKPTAVPLVGVVTHSTPPETERTV